jgi:drug/metabolite transporter (DMT)-like permease
MSYSSVVRARQHDIDWVRGGIYGAASAALFGLSAPLSKYLLPDVGPVTLAGLLYLGAGGGLTVVSLVRRRPWPRFTRSDSLRLACIAFVGGFLSPTLLLIGLRRVSGVVGSLAMNLEGVFTILLAAWLFRERLTPREWLGAGLILAGAALLAYAPGAATADALGLLAIAAACLGWAIDNNLTQQISSHDPVAIVQVKGLTAGVGNLLLARAIGEHAASGNIIAAALIVGFLCYGLSIVFDVYALRYLGAAREAAIFATAPFVGAAAAIPILGDRPTWPMLTAAALMAAGLLSFRFHHREADPHDRM